jgi:hypothetical protein
MKFIAALPPVVPDMGYETFQVGADTKKNIVLFGESATGFAAKQQHK